MEVLGTLRWIWGEAVGAKRAELMKRSLSLLTVAPADLFLRKQIARAIANSVPSFAFSSHRQGSAESPVRLEHEWRWCNWRPI